MTDKVQKIREEVERLKIQNETYVDKEYTESEKWSKHGAYHILFKLLDFIDSLPEEPVSDDFTKALAECISQAQCNVVDPMVHAETWKDELIKLAKSEEPVSEDLEEAASRYAKEEYNNVYPLPSQDDIDKWLFKEFGIIAGACSSVKEFEYNVARRVVEKAMEYAKEQMLKDAVEAAVTDIRTYKEENEVDFTIMLKKGIIPYELEQEVKLIIVKEG